MKPYRIFLIVLLTCFAVNTWAQQAVPDTLLFVFELHGQTRRYQMSFEQRQDCLVLSWGIERNLHWQQGSYTMLPASIENATSLSFLQPEDKKHVTLPANETAYVISRKAFRELKANHSFAYDSTIYRLLDENDTALGFPLLHVIDEADGGEMWILDYPALPLVWKMQNNPLEINWEVSQK